MKYLALAAALSLSACAPFLPSSRYFGTPMFVVSNLQPGQLAGTWYEVASFPQRFQQGCGLTTATYTPQARRDGGGAEPLRGRGRAGHRAPDQRHRPAGGAGAVPGAAGGLCRCRPKYWVLDISRDGRTMIVGDREPSAAVGAAPRPPLCSPETSMDARARHRCQRNALRHRRASAQLAEIDEPRLGAAKDRE